MNAKSILNFIKKHPFLILSALLPIALIGLITFISVYSADDFSYSTYFNDGLGGYFSRMVNHYQTMNGRVIVHVVAHLLLWLGNLSYALFAVFLTCFTPWVIARATGFSKKTALYAIGLFAIALAVLPPQVIGQSLLWISSYCNYFLPTAMLCGLIAFALRLRGKETVPAWQYVLLIVYALACGATTEQSGLLCIAVLLYFALTALWHRKKQIYFYLGAAAAAGIGLWTIFASPATEARLQMETGTAAGLLDLQSLLGTLDTFAWLLCQTPTFCILLALIFLLGGLKLFYSLKHRCFAFWTLAPASWAVVLPFIRHRAVYYDYGILMLAVLLLAVQLLFKKGESVGLMMLLAVGSVIVILPTTSATGRVFSPMFLYFFLAIILLICDRIAHLPHLVRGGVWLTAAGFSLFAVIPLIGGCFRNYAIDQINNEHIRQARETGVLYYCVDYDRNYTHTKPLGAYYCYCDFFLSIGMAEEELETHFYSEDAPSIYVGDTRTTLPVITNAFGDYLYPYSDIYNELGATLVWDSTDNTTTITYKDRVCHLSNPAWTEAKLEWTDENGETHSILVERNPNNAFIYLGEAAITEPFGLTVQKNDDNTITILP